MQRLSAYKGTCVFGGCLEQVLKMPALGAAADCTIVSCAWSYLAHYRTPELGFFPNLLIVRKRSVHEL